MRKRSGWRGWLWTVGVNAVVFGAVAAVIVLAHLYVGITWWEWPLVILLTMFGIYFIGLCAVMTVMQVGGVVFYAWKGIRWVAAEARSLLR